MIGNIFSRWNNIDEGRQLKIIGVLLVIYFIWFYTFDISPSFTAKINSILGVG